MMEQLTEVKPTWDWRHAVECALRVQNSWLVARDESYPPSAEMQVLPSVHVVSMHSMIPAINIIQQPDDSPVNRDAAPLEPMHDPRNWMHGHDTTKRLAVVLLEHV